MSTRKYIRYATRPVRCINLLLDILIFHLLLLTIILGTGLYLNGPEESEFMDSIASRLLNAKGALAYVFTFFAYYFVSELLIGKSPAKLMTRTKVVDAESLQSPAAIELIRRTFFRAYPLDAFSFFSGHNVHDKFSGTCVVHDKKLTRKKG